MGSKLVAFWYVALMVAVIVSLDVLFFRHHILGRFMVNVGIVLVFVAFYLTFLRRS